jgi:hypothetical protein
MWLNFSYGVIEPHFVFIFLKMNSFLTGETPFTQIEFMQIKSCSIFSFHGQDVNFRAQIYESQNFVRAANLIALTICNCTNDFSETENDIK